MEYDGVKECKLDKNKVINQVFVYALALHLRYNKKSVRTEYRMGCFIIDGGISEYDGGGRVPRTPQESDGQGLAGTLNLDHRTM